MKCVDECVIKLKNGVVYGYFVNKDCHFDTKKGASGMASPTCAAYWISSSLEVVEIDDVSSRIRVIVHLH